MAEQAKPRLLACASGGGHWIQLLRLRRAFEGYEVAYVSKFADYAASLDGARLHVVPDASRRNPLMFGAILLRAIAIVWRERPRAIVTTGAMPMLAFVLIGRLTGARTLWVDSIANAERLSTSGRVARRIAHRTISQWPDVAARENVECWGSVL